MPKVAALWVVAVCSVTAAPAVAGEVRVGVYGGPAFASLRSVPPDEGLRFRTRTLAGAGAVVDVGLDERLSLRLEPGYVVRGARFEIAPDDFLFEDRVTGSLRLSYLELPALLRITLGGRKVQPYALAGVTAGWLRGARVRAESGGVSQDEDVREDFEDVDLGVTGGGGVRVPVGRASVFLEGRYTLGLWNVAGDARSEKLKNRAFQVGAGLTFLSVGRAAGRPADARAQERRGFWVDFGLGHGLAKTTCDRASFRDGPELGTCEGGAGREGGAVGSFGLGGTVGSRLLLGAELTAWSGFTNPTPVESFARDTLLTSLMATARVYPVASAGGFLKGGVGLASHLSRTGERRRRHGLALAAGAGYDVRIGRNVSLTPLVEFLHGSVGDTTTPPGAITLADVRQSVWAGSLRLTLH